MAAGQPPLPPRAGVRFPRFVIFAAVAAVLAVGVVFFFSSIQQESATDDVSSSVLSVRDGTVAPPISESFDGLDTPVESALPVHTDTEEAPIAPETLDAAPPTRESSVLSVYDGTVAPPQPADFRKGDEPAESAFPVETELSVAPETHSSALSDAASGGAIIPASSPIIDRHGVVAPVYARAGISRHSEDGFRQVFDLAREISSANEASALSQSSKVQIRQARSTLALSSDDVGGRPLNMDSCTTAMKRARFQQAFGSTEDKISRPDWLQSALNAVKVTEKERWSDGELSNPPGVPAVSQDGFSPLDQAGAVACDLIRQRLGCFQLEGGIAPVPDCRSVSGAASFAEAIFSDTTAESAK